MKLVGGGSVINGATLFSLFVTIEFNMCVQVQNRVHKHAQEKYKKNDTKNTN